VYGNVDFIAFSKKKLKERNFNAKGPISYIFAADVVPSHGISLTGGYLKYSIKQNNCNFSHSGFLCFW